MEKMFINGRWIESSRTNPVEFPYTGEVIAQVPEAEEEHLEEALCAAVDSLRTISELPSHRRAEILKKVAEGIEEEAEEWAKLLTLETGKPIRESRGEVARAIRTLSLSAQEAERIGGEIVPMDAVEAGEGWFGFYIRVPVGVVVAITPFNAPLNLLAHKVGPAVAAGNSVVVKPSTLTPLSALKLASLFEKAGLPPGVLNVLTFRGKALKEKLVSDPRAAKVSFTGGLEAGEEIVRKAGLKRVSLELGSNSAVIVEEDADMERVVPACIRGAFANSGQVCISLQRIYVHRKRERELTEALVSEVKKLKVGDPREEDTDISCMVTPEQAERVISWIEEAKREGARVLVGGEKVGRATVLPTVLTDVHEDMRIVREEAFGPLVSLIPYDDLEEAVEMVNRSAYGLQHGIYTRDLGKAFYALRNIQAGGVLVNEVPTFRLDHYPYGGIKKSGLGREGVRFAVEEMTHIKFMAFHLK